MPQQEYTQVEVALEIASDQTVPDRSDPWSDKFQTIVQTKVRSKPFPDHVIRAHPEHVCARNSSDQGSLRSGHLDLGSRQTETLFPQRKIINCCENFIFHPHILETFGTILITQRSGVQAWISTRELQSKKHYRTNSTKLPDFCLILNALSRN